MNTIQLLSDKQGLTVPIGELSWWSSWLGVRLPVQGTWVWSLVCEDSIGPRASKPVLHNYWVHVLQLLKPSCPRACAPQQEKAPQWAARAPQLEKAPQWAARAPQREKAPQWAARASQLEKAPQWAACASQLENTSQWAARALQLEKAHVKQRRPSVAKRK